MRRIHGGGERSLKDKESGRKRPNRKGYVYRHQDRKRNVEREFEQINLTSKLALKPATCGLEVSTENSSIRKNSSNCKFVLLFSLSNPLSKIFLIYTF